MPGLVGRFTLLNVRVALSLLQIFAERYVDNRYLLDGMINAAGIPASMQLRSTLAHPCSPHKNFMLATPKLFLIEKQNRAPTRSKPHPTNQETRWPSVAEELMFDRLREVVFSAGRGSYV